MVNTKDKPDAAEHDQSSTGTGTGTEIDHNQSPMSKSMHDGVEVWCDCCSCEAEPYWVEAMKEYDQD